MNKSKWIELEDNGVPKPRKPITVRWWWYVIAVWALCIILAVIFAACGGDDGFTEEDYDWFPATSPSGVKVECIGYGEGIWCMRLGEP